MSDSMNDENSALNGLMTAELHPSLREPGVKHENEEAWLYEKQKMEENIDNTTAPSIDEITTQEIDARDKLATSSVINTTATSLIGSQLDDDDDDDDDDGIQVTIRSIKAGTPIFPPNRQLSRQPSMPMGPVIPPKIQTARAVDLDAQGIINGQPTFEHDLMNAYKDDEKPWKKPGADISDYFNYGFTEETWAQYCDRQRRLRAENNLARHNVAHIPPMPQMLPVHPPMMHPMNPHPAMIMNKPPMNVPIVPRPCINVRKQDGRIDVIGATDQTSRRQIFEAPNAFEHAPYMNGPPFAGGQPPNNQTVGELVTPPPASNGPAPPHGTPPGGSHPIPTLGAHRVPMMPPPPGMQFRAPFGHPHGPGAPPFFPHGPAGAMHGERPPQQFFVPHHPQQPWDKANIPSVHGFPPGHFPPAAPVPSNTGNGRPASSRSPTPEDHSPRSSTPEENHPSGNGGDNEKSKEDRYKDRYRDDREHYPSSRRRSSPKDRSSSSYRSRHRSGDHEYERPRGDRKSSRDRDDKYERYSRKRHHREDSGRHHRSGEDETSRSHRSSRRTPPKNLSSPPKTVPGNTNLSLPIEPSVTSIENPEQTEAADLTSTSNMNVSSSSSPNNRSRRDESERSSSRHGHHKKSSKRSRRDSGDERSHRRRSKDKSSSSKKGTTQTETSSDVKEQND